MNLVQKRNIFLFFCIFTFLLAALFPVNNFAETADREIIQITEDIYQFRNYRHYSVFMVTNKGIILTDPINTDAANWLKAKIKEKFNLPIRYVIYSHNHSDHVYGGEVYKSSNTQFISHQLAKQDLVSTKAKTVIPQITFSEQMTIELGGKTVKLRYHGPNDGRGSISMLFLPSQVIYVADWIVLDRMPWQKLWSYDIYGMINSNLQVEKLEFKYIATAHSHFGTKDKLVIHRQYLQALLAAVVEHINDGHSLSQMKEEIRLDTFKHLKHYEEWLPLNIEGVYDHLINSSGLGWRP